MSDKDKRYNAKLRVTMEYMADGVWGGDCTMQQIVNQAGEEGKSKLLNALAHVEKPFSSPKVVGLVVEEVAVVPEKRR
jgi:hypothetical protein